MFSTPRSKKAMKRLSQSEIPLEFVLEVEKQLSEIEMMNSKDSEFNSKLPALTELLNLKDKKLEKGTKGALVELMKYAQELENTIQVQKKEIKRLEYLNKYFVISQQKRDDMLKHALEDNRKLKELNIMYERTMKMYIAGSKKGQSFKNKSALPLIGLNLQTKNSISQFQNDSKLKIPSNYLIVNENLAPNEKRVSKAVSGIFENKSKESILSVSVSDSDVLEMANRNENLIFMKNLLADPETFASKLENLDSESVDSLFSILNNVTHEDFNFYKQIAKLKRVLKSAAFMNETMILSEAMERIVDETCNILDCDRCTVFLIDKTKDELWSKVAKGSNITIRIPSNKGVVGYVATTGESLNIMNAYSDPRFNKDVDKQQNYKTKTILCMPILERNNQVIGVVQAINKREDFFSKDDEGLLTLISHLASGILRNSLHYDEQLLFHTTLKHILKTGIYLNSFVSMSHLLPNAEKKLKDIMNVSNARILLLKENKLIHFAENEEPEYFDINCGIAGAVAQSGIQMSITSSYNHPLYNSLIDINTSMPIIALPLIHPYHDNVIGIIEVVNSKGMFGLTSNIKKPPITIYDQESLSFFSQQLSQAISKNFEEKPILESQSNL